MKAKIFSVVAVMLIAAAPARSDERMDAAQLPPPVNRALGAAIDQRMVREIIARKVAGETVYDITVGRKGAADAPVRVAADGTVLQDSDRVIAAPNLVPADPEFGGPILPLAVKLKLEDLPQGAQSTIRREAAGREVASIERTMVDGSLAYRVELREAGRNPRLEVAADGTLLQPQEKPPGIATLFQGMRFDDLPTAVQGTIRRETATGEILSIERSRPLTQPLSYEVSIKTPEGAAFRLRIDQAGAIQEDSRRGG